jgi:hypothetical protein
MNAKQYDKIMEAFNRKRAIITKSKRHDYAGEDVLGNFKRQGQIATILQLNELYKKYPAIAEALKDHLLKLDRIVNLLNKGDTPVHESIEDTFIDGANYWDLAYACYMEGKNRDTDARRLVSRNIRDEIVTESLKAALQKRLASKPKK